MATTLPVFGSTETAPASMYLSTLRFFVSSLLVSRCLTAFSSAACFFGLMFSVMVQPPASIFVLASSKLSALSLATSVLASWLLAASTR